MMCVRIIQMRRNEEAELLARKEVGRYLPFMLHIQAHRSRLTIGASCFSL